MMLSSTARRADPMRYRPWYRRVLSLSAAVILALCAVTVPANRVQASCNIIPGTSRAFRGFLATVDRPFAGPGEWVELNLGSGCYLASPGFSAQADEHVVTIVFKPPGGQSNIAVLAEDCAALGAELGVCEALAEVDSATCVPAVADDGISLPPFDLGVVMRDGERNLRFRFPDTDEFLGAVGDDHTFSGPAAIAVTGTGDSLPCSLAADTCSTEIGLVACADELYATDGTCSQTPHDTFAHFTALPPANDYQALCVEPDPPCTATAAEVRFTTDSAGNLLMPMDWRGILVGQGVPIARLLRGSSTVDAFTASPGPIVIPGGAFLASFSIEGGLLPPVFDPQHDAEEVETVTLFGSADAPATVLRIARRSSAFSECTGGNNNGLPCVEAEDCPDGACLGTTCRGGGNDGGACSSDAECPDGECGASLFDFSDRYDGGVGPVTISRLVSRLGRAGGGQAGICQGGGSEGALCANDGECPDSVCVAYRLESLDPVPLEGLRQTDEASAFTVSEAVAARDLNGDNDSVDSVITLSDRETGRLQPLGAPAGCGIGGTPDGRGVARITQLPFSYPAVAVEGDIAAFLESEPLENGCDINSDGDVFDTILRVFELGGSEVGSDVDPPITVDPEPVIGSRSIAVSGGQVFFRTREASGTSRQTVRVNVDSAGNEETVAECPSAVANLFDGRACPRSIAISEDGRFVAFSSEATNLVAGDVNDASDVFVHDLETGGTELASVASNGDQGDGHSGYGFEEVSISADGNLVAFTSAATNLVADDTNGVDDVFVRDLQATTTERVSVDSAAVEAEAASGRPSISGDGLSVAFTSAADNLSVTDDNAVQDVYLRDLQGDVTELISVSSEGGEGNGSSGTEAKANALSADGRFVAFTSFASNLVAGDTNAFEDVFVRDRLSGSTERVSVDSSGTQANGWSEDPSISSDGRFVAFAAYASNLAAGDTNDTGDVFVHDRDTGMTERVSVDSNGLQADGLSEASSISGDGRFVAFKSSAELAESDQYFDDVYVHDRWSGATEMVSLSSAGVQGDDESGTPFYSSVYISADGRFVAFPSYADNLVDGDTNAVREDVFVRGIDPADLTNDIFGDGVIDDTVLQVLDSTSGLLTPLCPATRVAVAGGAAAFLRPEAETGTAGCPGGPLNGDGDSDDSVVHLWQGGATASNLSRAAVAVSLSDQWLAALVSEAGQGGASLNSDADTDDDVVAVHRLGDPPGSWQNAGVAADALDVSGSTVVLLTPEADENDQDLNGDTDAVDRVIQIYDADADQVLNVEMSAEEFVLGSELLAFRTLESTELTAARQGIGNRVAGSAPRPVEAADLNADGDTDDAVLHVYDFESETLINTGQAVIPCRLEACDPRTPYRVLDDVVRFLTLESDQGEDLNGDGDEDDLILQSFNAAMALGNRAQATRRGADGRMRYKRTVAFGRLVEAGALTTFAAVSAGVCTDTAEACASDDDCPDGACFVPPGGCIEDLGKNCDADPFHAPVLPDCAGGQFCQPLLGTPGRGTCHAVLGSCISDTDCEAPAVCNNAGQNVNRLVAPLSERTGGEAVFLGEGRCLEECSTACASDDDCTSAQFCSDAGICEQEYGGCLGDEDCPPGATCKRQVVVAAAADSDGDEIPDPFDNCPTVANVMQEDTARDGVGDACTSCGNGVTDAGEECDDGNLVSCDTCDPNCTLPATCGNGFACGVEECDDGGYSADCDADCTVADCGDGTLNQTAGEECDDGGGNGDLADLCRTDCTLPACGDGIVDTGEGCDDGNNLNGDGCSAGCELEAAQGSDQRQCINALNKAGAKVEKAQGKECYRCVKGAGKGDVADAQACLTADGDEKVADAQAKTTNAETVKCGTRPDFGFVGAAGVNTAAAEASVALVGDLFGEPLTPAIILKADDSDGAKCQAAVVKAYEKLAASKLKTFIKCKKAGLEAGTIDSQSSLEACVEAVESDESGKIGKVRTKLSGKVTKKCTAKGVDLAAAFPASCIRTADFASRVDRLVECRACLLMNAMDDLAYDCDGFDDGAINGTCPPASAQARCAGRAE